jgi:hypothetical protein
MDDTSLIPTFDLRESLHFTLAGVDGSVSLCGPVEALDVAPCVDSVALDAGNPRAVLDGQGILHVRDALSPAELASLLERGPQLVITVDLGVTLLAELRWPLRVLPPDPVVYSLGEPLTATVEQRGPYVALTFGTNGQATSLAFVEADDLSEFSITTRGKSGRSGSSGSSGMSGSSGSSASCPSSSGGNGGNGSNGGRGGDGGDGGPGGDGGDIDITVVCEATCDELERIARRLLRTQAGPGGAGGKGGSGGRGGSGGQGGSGTSCTSSSFGSSPTTTYLSSGSRGSDGADGSSGSDGRNGPPGKPGRVEVHLRERATPR